MKNKADMPVITGTDHPAVTERWKIFCKTIQNKRAGFEVSVIPTGTPKSNNKLSVNIFNFLYNNEKNFIDYFRIGINIRS
jgi:hypothetical protein